MNRVAYCIQRPGGHLKVLYTGVDPIIMGKNFPFDLILLGT